ncbi:MAG: iron-sulfur cluster assembly protein [Lactobacillus sp.]|nr:iron-sulfur cluster assembly protein [Lactobacillus sp.]
MMQLQTVIDPELYVDVVNLGLIYEVSVEGKLATIKMTLTTMGCPLSDLLDKRIKKAVCELPEIDSVNIQLVWYPVWSPERMTDAAKEILGMKEEKPKTTSSANKVISLNRPIKEIADEYPDFVDDMYDIGFTRIKIPGMLNTVGRVMTLKLGTRAMHFNLDEVIDALKGKGYDITE